MFIKKTIKKTVHIYCEGTSEKNYCEALKANKYITKNYVLKPNSKENDLNNAILKSERLKGIGIVIIYIYDSDTFINKKKIGEAIKKKQKVIYFNEEDFEDFLKCHKTKKHYHPRKPRLSRKLIEEIRNLDLDYIQTKIKKPNKFKNFKSFYDLLIELFEERI